MNTLLTKIMFTLKKGDLLLDFDISFALTQGIDKQLALVKMQLAQFLALELLRFQPYFPCTTRSHTHTFSSLPCCGCVDDINNR